MNFWDDQKEIVGTTCERCSKRVILAKNGTSNILLEPLPKWSIITTAQGILCKADDYAYAFVSHESICKGKRLPPSIRRGGYTKLVAEGRTYVNKEKLSAIGFQFSYITRQWTKMVKDAEIDEICAEVTTNCDGVDVSCDVDV